MSQDFAFDLLEAIAEGLKAQGQTERAHALQAGFARATGGVDLPYLVEQLAIAAHPLTDPGRTRGVPD